MIVLIRADASASIGHGHVMRCLALAEAVRARGGEAIFLCRELPGHAFAAIQASGHELRVLDADSDVPAVDADATVRACADRCPADWVVVDHYGLDAGWAERVGGLAPRLLAIDDLANRPLACSLLLDVNWHEAPAARYAAQLVRHCVQLHGPRWALLRREFAAARAAGVERDGVLRRILVCFGGSDPADATGQVVEGLRGQVEGLQVDVVVGAGYRLLSRLKKRLAEVPGGGFSLAVAPADMAARMRAADLFIGSGGTMTWERACVGLPGITLPIADNQLELCARLDTEAEGIDLGPPSSASIARLPPMLAALRASPERLRSMSRAIAQRCDGRGATRVVEQLYALRAS